MVLSTGSGGGVRGEEQEPEMAWFKLCLRRKRRRLGRLFLGAGALRLLAVISHPRRVRTIRDLFAQAPNRD